jgi:DNA-directed RNA polymerase subunit M/transcription elongation factor TFIIS
MEPHAKDCPKCHVQRLWQMSTQIQGMEVYVHYSCLDCGYQFCEIYALQFHHIVEM